MLSGFFCAHSEITADCKAVPQDTKIKQKELSMKLSVQVRNYGLMCLGLIFVVALTQLSACAKNDSSSADTDSSQTTLSNFNLNCGSSSCVN